MISINNKITTSVYEKIKAYERISKKLFILLLMLVFYGYSSVIAQPSISAGQVDIFAGAGFNYRDLLHNGKIYEILLNLTPGVKWNMGKGWRAAAQVLMPVHNDYGNRCKKVRSNMAVLFKEVHWRPRWFPKANGGLFGREWYGLDLKGMYAVNRWLALEVQAGLTGYCSMAVGWEASIPKQTTVLLGTDVYLNKWNTQSRTGSGRFLYEDYGAIVEAMRCFNHCTVGLYDEYGNEGDRNAGFEVVMMISPYRRKRRTVNFRPASNSRLTYSMGGDAYANEMYMTDLEENERRGRLDRNVLQWDSNITKPGFLEKEGGRK